MKWTKLHNGIMRLRRRFRALARFEEWGLPGWARRGTLLLTAFIVSCRVIAYLMPDYPLDRDRYRIRRTSGLKTPSVYVFGLYYWGRFPVYSTAVLEERNPGRFSPEYAQRILDEKGDTLHMEYRHTARVGNNLKLYLPLLAARAFGRPMSSRETTRSLPFVHAAFFLLALYLLLHQFYRAGRPLLGCLTALLISSSEFQAVEILRWNIFSYTITTAVFTLALLAPLLFNRPRGGIRLALRLLIVAGLIVAGGSIRPDALTMILAPVFVLLLYRPLRFRRRLAAAAVFLLFCWGWNAGIRTYFDFKWRQAEEFVVEHGGTPYTGDRIHSHGFWHPLFVGLSDFDTVHGYNWSDWQGWNYARRVMRERGIYVERPRWVRGPAEMVEPGDYHKIDTHPAYEPIIREKVLSDIRADPLWYLDIIRRRLIKIFTEWQDVRLNLLLFTVTLPYSFWPYLVFFILLLFLKMDGEVKLIVASTPIVLTAVIITTVTNVHFYFIGHLVAAGVFLACLLNTAAFGLFRMTGKTVPLEDTETPSGVSAPSRRKAGGLEKALVVLAAVLLAALAAYLFLHQPGWGPEWETAAVEEDLEEETEMEFLSWMAANPLFQGLRLALPFDGSLDNRSPIPHSPTAGRPLFNPEGRHGKSYEFRDLNVVTIPGYSFSNYGTWAFWFKLKEDYDLETEMRLLDTNGTGVGFNDGELTAYFHDGRSRVMNAPLPETGRWHHLAMTWDSGDLQKGLKIYLNGELVGAAPYSGAPGFPRRTLRMGGSWRGRHPFSGMIDEFYAFDRALTAGEIEKLMETPMPEPPGAAAP